MLFALSNPADADADNAGRTLYQQCAACHLPSAQGVPGMFPPLAGRLGHLTRTQAGRDYLAMVVEAGLTGGIQVGKVNYQSIMPAQGFSLGEEGIAAVLNYVLEFFNKETLPNNWRPYTQKEIAGIKLRYPNATGQTTHTLRQSVFADEP